MVPVSDEIVSAVVPSGAGVAEAGRRAAGVVRSLPVAEVPVPTSEPTMVYGMGRVDASGRISQRALVRALGWQPGQRVAVELVAGSVLVRPDAAGTVVLGGKPYVVLPAAVRLRCGVRAGDAVLVAARLDRGVLVVHPLSVVDGWLAEHHAGLLGGEVW